MKVITRFAPSPTGYLHVGNIRTAIISYLHTRAMKGDFILRIDDTDLQRSKPIYTSAVINDLKWLGLEWDRIEYQSQRFERYEKAKQYLINSGRLYPCYESQEELDLKRKNLLSRNLPPIYDRAALKLSDQQINELNDQGKKPHWRFFINDEDIEWTDKIRGPMLFKPQNITDPVLIRADGSITYTIATIVDDIEFKITDIVRGEDHLTNSAIHVQLFKAFNAEVPNFAHLSNLVSNEGKISKRLGGFDIQSLKENGIEPMTILSFLVKIGSSDSVEFRQNIDDLMKEFLISKYSKSPITYDYLELQRLNSKYIHSLSFRQVKDRFDNKHMNDIDENFWEVIKPNLSKVSEFSLWFNIIEDKVTPIIDDIELTKLAATLLPENISISSWDLWIEAIKVRTNKRGKKLFLPIRKALTSFDNGPELKYILPLIDRQKIIDRLNGRVA